MLIEDFSDGDAAGWSYVSDRVMGGISNGTAQIEKENAVTFARLSGEVSTANNGGFIQIRRQLVTPFPTNSVGISLDVRGNDERYYVHLRPFEARRPWQYYSASFVAPNEWRKTTLKWTDFVAQGGLSSNIDPSRISSIGVVAYGADYSAQLDILRIEIAEQ